MNRPSTVVERAVALRSVEAFRNVPMEQLATLATVAADRSFGKGEALFLEGDPPGGLVIILEGTVGLERGGRPAGEAGPGETLGGWSLFEDHARRAAAIARTAVRVLVVEREAFYEVLADHPELLRSLLGDLARRLLELAGGAEGSGA